MHYHIVTYILQEEHQQTVEVQVALPGTGTPAALLRPDGDAAIADADKCGKACYTLRNILFCSICQLVQLFQGQGGCTRFLPLLDDVEVLLNPRCLGVNKALNVFGSHP